MNQVTKTISEIIIEAQQAAELAANDYLEHNGDRDCCGFAWVWISEFNGKKIRGNSKIAKELVSLGITQDYTRRFVFWNPGRVGVQSLNVIEAGAYAAAKVLKENGFTASASSRMD